MMGKKSRRKMTGLTEEQRIEVHKRVEERLKELEKEKVKALTRAILHKVYSDAEARDQLLKAIKDGVKDETVKD